MAATIFVVAVTAALSIVAWRSLPQPGASGRFVFGICSVLCAHRLTNGGDGTRTLSLRAIAWLTPLLLLQLIMHALVATGTTTLD